LRNAVDEVKELADFVTSKTNNEEGATEFLEQVLISKTNKHA
jgi:hydroxymethylpyrimidine pyrophosphatase-like HAD family hydrolase